MGSNGYNEIKSHPFFKTIDWEKLEKKELVSPLKDFIDKKLSQMDSKQYQNLTSSLEFSMPGIAFDVEDFTYGKTN